MVAISPAHRVTKAAFLGYAGSQLLTSCYSEGPAFNCFPVDRLMPSVPHVS